MSNETTLNKLWESSNHGTRLEDLLTAFNAGVTAERERLGMDAPPMEEPISERLQDHDFQTLKSLILSINDVCPAYGTVNVGCIEIGGQRLKPITIAGNGIKKEGETFNAIYASIKLACDAALQAFKEIHQSYDSPSSMLWRMKPQICSYVVGEGLTYYAVKMRVLFLA